MSYVQVVDGIQECIWDISGVSSLLQAMGMMSEADNLEDRENACFVLKNTLDATCKKLKQIAESIDKY